MAYNRGYGAYKNASITTASQGHLVVLLYEGAVKNLKTALGYFESDDTIKVQNIEKFSKTLQKAEAIISELQVSLNMEAGGDIAKNLMSLYIYFNNELLDASIKHDRSKIENVLRMLEDMTEAWKTASSTTANTKVRSGSSTLNIMS